MNETRVRHTPLQVICLDCGELHPHAGRGLCVYCHRVRSYASTLEEFPLLHTHLSHLWRMEDFGELYEQLPKPTKKQIADRMQVTVRTVERYIAKYNAQKREQDAPSSDALAGAVT